MRQLRLNRPRSKCQCNQLYYHKCKLKNLWCPNSSRINSVVASWTMLHSRIQWQTLAVGSQALEKCQRMSKCFSSSLQMALIKETSLLKIIQCNNFSKCLVVISLMNSALGRQTQLKSSNLLADLTTTINQAFMTQVLLVCLIDLNSWEDNHLVYKWTKEIKRGAATTCSTTTKDFNSHPSKTNSNKINSWLMLTYKKAKTLWLNR